MTPTTATPERPVQLVGLPLRYPGSAPFDSSDLDRALFKGRDHETQLVLHSILSHDLFVLYATSGTGKTSLLKAGVLHELQARDMWPVFVRLDQPELRPVDLITSALRDSDGTVEIEHRLGSDAEPVDLWNLLVDLEIWRDDVLQMPVLIFDQFEELFTNWEPERRAEFITEFSELVRGAPRRRLDGSAETRRPRVKIVLSMREDFLGHLDEFSTDVPQIMRHRYRLRRLTSEQAIRAIVEPAKLDHPGLGPKNLAKPFTYDQGALDLILDFLTTQQQRGAEIKVDEVEAFQLQILCHHIEVEIAAPKWDAIYQAGGENPKPPIISVEDLRGQAGLTDIYSSFYAAQVDKFPKSERSRIQNVCENHLINNSKPPRRATRDKQELMTSARVTEAQLDQLVKHRLVRTELRVGNDYYELAHDSLVASVLARKAERVRHAWQIGGAVFGLLAILGLSAALVFFVRPDPSDILDQVTRVTVTDAGNGEKLPGVTVTVIGLDDNRPIDTTTTNEAGVAIARLASADLPVRLDLSIDGFADLSHRIDQDAGRGELELALHEAIIAGKVENMRDGESVLVQLRQGTLVVDETDADPGFEFKLVVAGDYELQFIGETHQLLTIAVTVAPGQTLERLVEPVRIVEQRGVDEGDAASQQQTQVLGTEEFSSDAAGLVTSAGQLLLADAPFHKFPNVDSDSVSLQADRYGTVEIVGSITDDGWYEITSGGTNAWVFGAFVIEAQQDSFQANTKGFVVARTVTGQRPEITNDDGLVITKAFAPQEEDSLIPLATGSYTFPSSTDSLVLLTSTDPDHDRYPVLLPDGTGAWVEAATLVFVDPATGAIGCSSRESPRAEYRSYAAIEAVELYERPGFAWALGQQLEPGVVPLTGRCAALVNGQVWWEVGTDADVLEGTGAWVPSHFLAAERTPCSPNDSLGVVKALPDDTLAVRSHPGTNAALQSVLRSGAPVDVGEGCYALANGRWVEITANGTTGWVAEFTLE